MRALKGAGIIFAGIVGAASFIYLVAVYIGGFLWVSKNVLEYLNIAALIAFAICVFVLLPLSLFRVTRIFSAYGFHISSVIFGVSTLVLGFLVTFQYWGAAGLIVGVMLAGVGIVPIGILASAFNGGWPQVGDLTLGLVLNPLKFSDGDTKVTSRWCHFHKRRPQCETKIVGNCFTTSKS